MELGLEGKRALITGAGRGIGASIATALAAEGAEVCLLSRTEAQLREVCTRIQAAGGKAGYEVFDLAKDDAGQLRERLEAASGAIDIVVGNAARASRPKKLTHMDEQDWYKTVETDLNGNFRLLRAFLPGMQERGWGRVVLIGSLSGMLGASAYPAYCTVKAGFEGLVKNLAVDYSKYGITVNLVSPGFVETERFQAAAPPEFIARFKAATASKRLARPEDVADTVLFLASDRASYITGVNLPVCGGLNLGNLW
ncbi:MAG: SDR family NAD(P)-dependent oxidoreductase [Candidatus Sericytochromatia bacterium]